MNKWVTVWGNATSVAERRVENYAKNVTLRYPVPCAFGGDKVRLHFSNFCGTESVTLSQVTVAPAISDREINLKDARLVTFGGNESVTLAAGEEIFSDEISFRVKPLGKVSVSVYLKDSTLMRSAVVIKGPLSKGFFSVGNCALTSVLPLENTRTTDTFYFLTGLDVWTEKGKRSVICYGDSITAQSWADYFALKCMDNAYNSTAVVRRAASGTRILREYTCVTYESYGLKGENRFEREVSSVSGADSVIIQQGINDIIHPVGTEINPFRPMSDLPSVEELCRGIDYYINKAKARGLKVYLGTLWPIYGWRTYAPFREEMRNAFNEWIRGRKDCTLIDFDALLRDKRNPSAFAQGYDSGDHLHPSEEAYKKMAELAYGIACSQD